MRKLRNLLGVSVGAVASSMLMAQAAYAQMATSGIHGEAAPNAQVVARNVDTGFTTTDVSDADGGFRLQGLQPGTYDVTVTAGGETVTQRVRVLVGQTSFLALGPAEEGEIVVTGRRLDDPTTSEVGTNVTREQIEGLPQNTRNFITFATLAPGVRVTTEGSREVTFSGVGQNPMAVNVFIDGQSQKAQIIDGGFVGQDDSRGNPFPQLAVQEFRVLTQNFSAEYDNASSSIITSVTRSGGNEFEFEAFATYQPSEAVSFHRLGPNNTAEEPETERQQYGFAVGGPIVRDQLQFFLTYEGRRDDKFGSVFLGRSGFEDRFGQFEGVVEIPFEEDLFFGKLTLQPVHNQRFDLSASYRTERDIRDVGGQDAAERANAVDIWETKFNLRHDWQGDEGWSNIAQLDFLESNYNPSALNFTATGEDHIVFRDADAGTPGFQYNFFSQDGTVIRLGGRDSNQNIRQQTFTARDDFTFPGFELAGAHSVQVGVRVAWNSYFVEKELNRNPFFSYDVEGRSEINNDPTIPVRVIVGSPVPAVTVHNTVYGFYIQDDWQITDRLEVNLGLRWDYEDNAYNNDYRTPDNIVGLLNAFEAFYAANPTYVGLAFNPDDYIANGDRDAFKEAWQPRLGFSYDISGAGDESTVIFGGAGRYYDRIPYNFAFDERFKPTQFIREFFFSTTGAPGTILWDPSYATPEGLQPLIDANPGAGEVFLIRNGAEPPVTDQFNLGIRQRFGDWRASLTLSHAETRNGFGWYIGNLGTGPDPRFNGPSPGSLGFSEFRNLVFYSTHDQEREFNALYLTAERPYNEESGWGLSVSYTYSEATQNGSRDNNTAPFDFDYVSVEDTPTFDSAGVEEHRVVVSGMYDLPWNMRFSGIGTYGSGLPFHIFGPNPPLWNEGRKDEIFVLDLRLSKYVEFGEGGDGGRIELFIDALNVTDEIINPEVEQCLCAGAPPFFGEARNQFLEGRSFQVGARARW